MPLEIPQIIELLRTTSLFYKLPEGFVEKAAKLAKIYSFEEGVVIFPEVGEVPALLFVHSGKVQLTYHRKNKVGNIGIYQKGDILGYEYLKINRGYLTAAVAREKTFAVGFDREDLRLLVSDSKDFYQNLEICFNSYFLSLDINPKWLNQDELCYFVARRHPIDLVSRLAPPSLFTLIALLILYFLTFIIHTSLLTSGIFLGVTFFIVLGWYIWGYLDWADDFAIITNQRVVFQESMFLLYDNHEESPLSAIQSISTKTSQIGRILGYGDVVVRTFAGLIELPRVKNPELVINLLELQWTKAKFNRNISEKMLLETTIKNRLGLTPPGNPTQVAPPTPSGKPRTQKFSRLFHDLFRLRISQGEVITYRTHWWLLVKRVWIQSFLIIGIIGILIARVINLFTYIPTGILAISIVILMIPIGVWWAFYYVDWRNDIYVITPEQIMDINRRPFSQEEKKVGFIKDINNVEFKRLGILGLLLNFGTVFIKVGDSVFTFDDVPDPADVQRELFKRIAEIEEKRKKAELKTQQDQQKWVTDWLLAYHDVIEKDKKNQKPAN